MSFNIGDRVSITMIGCLYTTYKQWLVKEGIPAPYFNNYFYGLIPSFNEREHNFKVVARGTHSADEEVMLYLIESCEHNCYLIDEEGITKVPSTILDWFD